MAASVYIGLFPFLARLLVVVEVGHEIRGQLCQLTLIHVFRKVGVEGRLLLHLHVNGFFLFPIHGADHDLNRFILILDEERTLRKKRFID